jgi:hypothetical protein
MSNISLGFSIVMRYLVPIVPSNRQNPIVGGSGRPRYLSLGNCTHRLRAWPRTRRSGSVLKKPRAGSCQQFTINTAIAKATGVSPYYAEIILNSKLGWSQRNRGSDTRTNLINEIRIDRLVSIILNRSPTEPGYIKWSSWSFGIMRSWSVWRFKPSTSKLTT